MKTTIAAIALALTASPAFAQGLTGGDHTYGSILADIAMKRMEMEREICDKNKDGMVSKGEYMDMVAKKGEMAFKMMDMDGDGEVSKSEWTVNPELHGSLSGYIFGGR
jgi:hypothetical protein